MASPHGSEQSRGDAQQSRRRRIEEQQKRLRERMKLIENVLVVLSGKGGVGKSTVAVNLATALCRKGRNVGLLDADMHGPSTPKMLKLEGADIYASGAMIRPAVHSSGLKVMSMGFLVGEADKAVVWRGPLKMNVLRQLLADVEWGELDYLVIDLPPGTGDEALSVCQLISDPTGAIVVTTPQEVALSDVRKCVNFCRDVDLPVTGVVENMRGFVCPHCGERSDIFGTGGGERMAGQMDVLFLGRLPLDPRMVEASDRGDAFVEGFPDSNLAGSFGTVVEKIIAVKEKQKARLEE